MRISKSCDRNSAAIASPALPGQATALAGTETALRHIAARATCLLWYADIEERGEHLHWELHLPDEEAAQRFLPLDVNPGERYQDRWYRSRLEEDRVRADEFASAELRADSVRFIRSLLSCSAR